MLKRDALNFAALDAASDGEEWYVVNTASFSGLRLSAAHQWAVTPGPVDEVFPHFRGEYYAVLPDGRTERRATTRPG